MGLIKAAQAATGTVMADQWKEFFYCDSLDNDTLLVRGKKRTGSRSSNTNGNDNIISNGSGIAVADGQCMLIVDQGKIAEVCAEPGEYTYDTSSEPSIFAGNLSDSIKNTFLTIGKRFSYGGDTGKDQRVYYINTKEITDNKFGTANPVWFRVVDKRINLDKDIEIRCNGVYSFKITNPLLFYTSLSGNVAECYEKSEIMPQLKTEFVDALQPAFAKIAEMEIRPSQIPAHATEIGDAMNEILTKKWSEIRGLSIVSVAFNPVTLKEEDAEAIRQAQNTSMYTDPSMMAATLGMAQAEAMKNAASNPNGAMMGFMGMNMASGGMNIQGLYDQGAAQKQAQQEQQVQKEQNQANGQNPQAGEPQNLKNKAATPAAGGETSSWTCSCGQLNNGRFCIECGKPKPQDDESWTCSCGTLNKGKFCMECGKPKPQKLHYHCDKCGWEPENPANPPKFCPECGDPFTDDDRI